MQLKSLASLLLVWLAVACKPPPPELPLEEATLVRLLSDLHLAESIVQEADFQARDSLTEIYYDRVALHYELERSELDSLLQLIRNQPVLMEKLYRQVYEGISARDAERQGVKVE